MIYVIGHKDLSYVSDEDIVIDTTSHSNGYSRELSPFFLGPVGLYGGYEAKRMENAWQYSKCYARFLDNSGNPSPEYFEWAKKGWADDKANRYPMGKGARPVFSYWDGRKLTYIEARKEIYIPLYSQLVQKTKAFKRVQELSKGEKDVYLLDFDGYNHKMMGISYDDVVNNEKRSMGHAFIIAMLVEGYL